MLKIKDNVDLKELEKFGIKKYCSYGYVYSEDKKDNAELLIDKINDNYFIVINPFGDNDLIYHACLDKIYDLIQAGLVEKVEDK